MRIDCALWIGDRLVSGDAQQTPTLATVLDRAFTARAQGMRVALPGLVQTYDPTTQTCSVQPLVQDGVYDETGTRTAERLPVVASVPVCFPGSGAFSITWPVKPGDTVLLVFSSSSIDRWMALGGEVDPIDDRRHHITDAVAIVGLRDLGHALTGTSVDPSAMVISGTSGGTPSLIATQATLAAFNTALSSAIATMGASPYVVSLTALQTALTNISWPSSLSSVKVK